MAHSSEAIGLSIEPGNNAPLYQQVFDQVVERIRNGALPDGYRLPASRALARALGTHRNTIVRAYETLESAGFVTSVVGRGTFVCAPVASPKKVGAPPKADAPATRIPWDSLTSRACEAEPLFRFERIARSVHSQGSRAINLTRMQPPEELLPVKLLGRCVDHVLRTSGARALCYAPRDGLPRLRTAISEDLGRRGVPVSPNDILITTGSQQALDLIARALVNPGDVILVEQSTYAGLLTVFGAAGARFVSVPSDDEGPDMNALSRLSRSSAKGLYLMPDCQNPTGRSISAARRTQLIHWSKSAGVPLIEDDYAADLTLDGSAPPSLRAQDGEVLYLGTYSKKLIPSLRVGFVILPRPLRSRMVALKHAMDLGTSALMQLSLAEFLERGYMAAHLRTIVPEYRRRRDALETSLRAHLPSGLSWVHPTAGMALWVPLPEGMDPEAVFYAAHEEGVLVTPSSLHCSGSSGPAGVRLAYCAQPPRKLALAGRKFSKAITGLLKTINGATEFAPLEVV